mmetsp:Transcript_22218/g.34947  ORF Transcript_22218/g.34947 Transcript_22218/m.34947 type:complete len:218 (-) Transcript_22218:55-708(-)
MRHCIGQSVIPTRLVGEDRRLLVHCRARRQCELLDEPRCELGKEVGVPEIPLNSKAIVALVNREDGVRGNGRGGHRGGIEDPRRLLLRTKDLDLESSQTRCQFLVVVAADAGGRVQDVEGFGCQECRRVLVHFLVGDGAGVQGRRYLGAIHVLANHHQFGTSIAPRFLPESRRFRCRVCRRCVFLCRCCCMLLLRLSPICNGCLPRYSVGDGEFAPG